MSANFLNVHFMFEFSLIYRKFITFNQNPIFSVASTRQCAAGGTPEGGIAQGKRNPCPTKREKTDT